MCAYVYVHVHVCVSAKTNQAKRGIGLRVLGKWKGSER